MRSHVAVVLLAIFTLALSGYTYLQYVVFTWNDCHLSHHSDPEFVAYCDGFFTSQPDLIFWRAGAIELLAIVAFLLYRRFACSRKS